MSCHAHARKIRCLIPLLLASASVVAMTFATGLEARNQSDSRRPMESWLGAIAIDPTPATAASVRGAVAAKLQSGQPDAAVATQLKWWLVGGPAYRWNEIILDEMQEAFVVLPMAARHLALFHAAIDDAVVSSRQHGATTAASEYAAVAEAASMILAHLYPERASRFAKKAEEVVTIRRLAGADTVESIAAGRSIGQKVAIAAIARAKADGSDAIWTGTVPEGPSRWKGTNPIAPMAGTWRTWVLSSPGELRPPAPPALDSEQVKVALDELKAFARTPRTSHRASYWEVHGGARAHILWNEIARTKLLEYGMGDDEGAHVLAALNVALADAGVACWDAKYTYWFIRPPQLDPELKALFAPPNHPSYPAAHGCYSTAAATVLAGIFTGDGERLRGFGREAAESRVWAGIHYRFDIDVGQELGRMIGERVLARTFAPLTR